MVSLLFLPYLVLLYRTLSPYIRLLLITVLQFWLLAMIATIAYLVKGNGFLHPDFPFEACGIAAVAGNLVLMMVFGVVTRYRTWADREGPYSK